MHSILIFGLGVMVGGMIGVVTMCLVQINRYRGMEDFDYTSGSDYEDTEDDDEGIEVRSLPDYVKMVYLILLE